MTTPMGLVLLCIVSGSKASSVTSTASPDESIALFDTAVGTSVEKCRGACAAAVLGEGMRCANRISEERAAFEKALEQLHAELESERSSTRALTDLLRARDRSLADLRSSPLPRNRRPPGRCCRPPVRRRTPRVPAR